MALSLVIYSGCFSEQIVKGKVNALCAVGDHDFFPTETNPQTLHKQIKVLPIAY